MYVPQNSSKQFVIKDETKVNLEKNECNVWQGQVVVKQKEQNWGKINWKFIQIYVCIIFDKVK